MFIKYFNIIIFKLQPPDLNSKRIFNMVGYFFAKFGYVKPNLLPTQRRQCYWSHNFTLVELRTSMNQIELNYIRFSSIRLTNQFRTQLNRILPTLVVVCDSLYVVVVAFNDLCAGVTSLFSILKYGPSTGWAA